MIGFRVTALVATLSVLGTSPSAAQTDEHETPTAANRQAEQPNLGEPMDFAGNRRLSPEDLARKNDGGYFTGLPLANFDPNSGFGFGVRGYRYENGEASDPRFPYTPYLHRVFLQLFATTGGLQFHWLDYDAPAFAGSSYRLRGQLIYLRNKAQHFYGLGEASNGELSFRGAGQQFSKFSDYQRELDRVRPDGTTLSRYDEYDNERPIVILGVERSFFRNQLRVLLGGAGNYTNIRDYSGKTVVATDATGVEVDAVMGKTRLAEECEAERLIGCHGGLETYLRLAVSIDTRDFEPDPNSGVFADVALDLAPGVVSTYRFARLLLSARGYLNPIPRHADLVIAARATVQWQSAGTPFFSLNTIPWTEDVRTGLGGIRTLRGFKSDRFVGRVFGLANLELRWTFYRFEVLNQKFALIGVPFVDVGRTFDDLGSVSHRRWRRGQGAAFRISWNLATIVTAEYGVSDEDAGLYINFAHMF